MTHLSDCARAPPTCHRPPKRPKALSLHFLYWRLAMSFSIFEKELEIIKAEIANSGKPLEMVEKISKGKIEKFLKRYEKDKEAKELSISDDET